MSLVFLTLGPAGTCHERATKKYIEFQGIADARIELIDDYMSALESVRKKEADFIVQNSAHPQVYAVTEKHFREVFVIDNFLFPTQEMAVLTRVGVTKPKSLGIMPATKGYIDTSRWEEVIEEYAKPVVAQNLLAGKYDSGLTHLRYAQEHPDKLRVDIRIGSVDTSWLVYGRNRRCQGEVIAVHAPSIFV